MKNQVVLFSGIVGLLTAVLLSCATTQEEGSNVVSNDAERSARLDSLSTVKKDSVVIQNSFRQPTEKPPTKKDDK